MSFCMSLLTGRDNRRIKLPCQKVGGRRNQHLLLGINEKLRPIFKRHRPDPKDPTVCQRCFAELQSKRKVYAAVARG
jgi:hypothetical protein